MSETERVLLVGGPCDWRTTVVVKGQYQLLIPLPIDRSLLMQAWDEVSELSSIPMVGDLKVARYTRQSELAWKGKCVGALFEYEESR